MFLTDLLSIIRSLNTVFTATGICYSEILKLGKITSIYVHTHTHTHIYIYIYTYIYTYIVKWYAWSIPLYGAETWTLRTIDQKHLESFETWCWMRMEKISWTDHVRNEDEIA